MFFKISRLKKMNSTALILIIGHLTIPLVKFHSVKNCNKTAHYLNEQKTGEIYTCVSYQSKYGHLNWCDGRDWCIF